MLNVEIQSDKNTNTNTVDTGWSMRVGASWWSHYHKWLTLSAPPTAQVDSSIRPNTKQLNAKQPNMK